jgi:pyruvate dehydrogenase E2 component (dihydrolipoamide acetyltransferase)
MSSAEGRGLYREEEAPPLRKAIARRMTESKSGIPHFYLTVDVEAEKLVDFRTALNAGRQTKISYNDVILKAVARTLQAHPECNVSYHDGKIRYYAQADLCLAVAVPGGLLTPVVRNCGKKSIVEISGEAYALVAKARSKRLRPGESMGGSFTLTNLGMYGIEQFAAIRSPGERIYTRINSMPRSRMKRA